MVTSTVKTWVLGLRMRCVVTDMVDDRGITSIMSTIDLMNDNIDLRPRMPLIHQRKMLYDLKFRLRIVGG